MNVAEYWFYRITKAIEEIYHTEHTVWDIISQMTFMFGPAMAMFMLPSLGLFMELNGYTFSEQSMASYRTGLGWFNFLMNTLFFLVIIETSQSLINWYAKYRSENL